MISSIMVLLYYHTIDCLKRYVSNWNNLFVREQYVVNIRNVPTLRLNLYFVYVHCLFLQFPSMPGTAQSSLLALVKILVCLLPFSLQCFGFVQLLTHSSLKSCLGFLFPSICRRQQSLHLLVFYRSKFLHSAITMGSEDMSKKAEGYCQINFQRKQG